LTLTVVLTTLTKYCASVW